MTTDTIGGVWTFGLTLAGGLVDAGIAVDMVTSGPLPSPQQRASCARRGIRLHEIECATEWMDDPWRDVARWTDALRTVAALYRPDVLHANAYAPAAQAWDMPVLLTCHSCVATWWRAVHGCPPPARFDRYTRMVASALDGAGKVVAPTAAFGRAMERAYRPARPINCIRNGGGEGFASGAKQRVVMGAGRAWDEAKNAAALAAAAPLIRAPVWLAGAGATPTPGVTTLGRLGHEALARRLARAAVFAHPARYEPFGLVALEAACAGCALLLGDVPTLREVWEGAAVFVHPDDHEGLAREANALLDDRAERERLAGLARRRASALSSAAMCRGYLAAYRALGRAAAPEAVRR